MVTVKQNTLHNDLPEFLSLLKEEQVHMICFQNGTGHMEMLGGMLPNANLYVAVTTEAAKRKSLTEVIHAGAGEVWIGKWSLGDGQAHSIHNDLKANNLIEVLIMAGFAAFLSNEVDTMIYRKLLINAVINPLTAIWRIPNGELLSSEQRLQLMKEVFEEAIIVYDFCEITYDKDAWDNILQVSPVNVWQYFIYAGRCTCFKNHRNSLDQWKSCRNGRTIWSVGTIKSLALPISRRYWGMISGER